LHLTTLFTSARNNLDDRTEDRRKKQTRKKRKRKQKGKDSQKRSEIIERMGEGDRERNKKYGNK
jgi:hypothetical protein